jgi:probable phosphoglycerate mutase
MQLILIRHALPMRVETLDGSPADPPLSASGSLQAARLADWLARRPLDRLYSSPLRRARETAAPIASRLGLALEIEPRVSEFDREADLYVPLEELKRSDYEAWLAFVRGGYGNDLDVEGFRSGVVAGLEEIIAANPGRSVGVVCHGGVINAWAAHVLGMSFRLFFGPDYTSLSRFMAARSGERSVESLNETPHLQTTAREA